MFIAALLLMGYATMTDKPIDTLMVSKDSQQLAESLSDGLNQLHAIGEGEKPNVEALYALGAALAAVEAPWAMPFCERVDALAANPNAPEAVKLYEDMITAMTRP